MAEKEYIERESLLHDVENIKLSCFRVLDAYLAEMYWKITSEIEKQPAADVRPVVRGRWIAVASARGGHECSVCHEYAPSFQNGIEHTTNFCPNCGADMRKE